MPAAIGLVDLGILLALALLIALSYAYNYSLGAAIAALAKAIGSIRLPGFLGGGRVLGFAADALEKVDHTIRHQLGVGIEALQATWNEAISYTAQAIHWIGHEIAALAHDTAHAVEHLGTTQVTNVYKRANPGLVARVGALAGLVATLARRVAHVEKKAARAVSYEIHVLAPAISVPDVGAIPETIPKVGALEDAASWARHEIKKLARTLTPAGIIGLVGATVFSHFGLNWLRCRGVNKAGRFLCGLSGWIETLASDAILAFAVTDLCRFSRLTESVAEEIRPVLLGWVDVEKALLQCPSASYPRDFAVAAYSPTPVVDPLGL